MADRASPSLSRIPVPMKSPPPRRADQPLKTPQHTSIISITHNTGNGNKPMGTSQGTPKSGKNYKSYVMAGDALIKNDARLCDKLSSEEVNQSKIAKESHIPKFNHGSSVPFPNLNNARMHQPNCTLEMSPKIATKIPGRLKSPQENKPASPPLMNSRECSASVVEEFPIVHAPVAEMEELSDLSQSSCSESEIGLDSEFGIDRAESSPSSLPMMTQTSPDRPSSSQGILHAASSGGHIANVSDTSISFPEPLSSGDSGFVHDGHASDPDLPDRSASATTFEKYSSYREPDRFVPAHHRGPNSYVFADRGPERRFPSANPETDRFASVETFSERERATSCGHNDSGSRQATVVGCHGNSSMVASSSGERFMLEGDRPLVRTSKSHENYLQAVTGVSVVNIDIDIDDSLAYSLDTLTYPANSDSSLEKVPPQGESAAVQMSRSLHSSPERRSEKNGISNNRDCMPGSKGLDECKEMKLKFNKQREDRMLIVNENSSNDSIDQNKSENSSSVSEFQDCMISTKPVLPSTCAAASPVGDHAGVVLVSDSEDILLHQNSATCPPPPSGSEDSAHHHHLLSKEETEEDSFAEQHSGDTRLQHLSVLSDDSDSDSVYHQPSKAVDRPSAVRLAKRLFHLEGFRKSDVSRHLYKKNDFSNLVAEEYLKYFDFQEDTLDSALRKFLFQFSLYGETQERERVLAHFSQRFMECNPGSFNSDDACHTLTCAIMLLHSDLHAKNVRRRMTCQEFIENLSGLNDGENFPKEVLKAIYLAIKNGSIEWACDEEVADSEAVVQEQTIPPQSPVPVMIGGNPFLEVPDPSKAVEYKKGYVMRKCCMEPEKRKTPIGRRGWKMMYAVLKDMILYQYKDEHYFAKGQFVQSSHNAIRVHHCLATKATDYTKKQHVFRLQTADWAEFLFQTGNPGELQEWVDTINVVSASLSAPPLPGAVGSRVKFQRPLLPASFTKLNMSQQLHSHEVKAQELEQELVEHRVAIPEKGARNSLIQDYLDKETYLEFEIKRFKTYVYLLQCKAASATMMPDSEASLAETAIGEYEELGAGLAGASVTCPAQTPSGTPVSATAVNPANPTVRSLSDRYSYRAAIYQNDHAAVEYDMV